MTVVEQENLLLQHLDQLHTIASSQTKIQRKEKIGYALTEACQITINAHSYTVITDHREKIGV